MPRTSRPSLRVRLAAYSVALLFVVSDQWTKAIAVESLASPIHPMVVAGDGVSPVHALFAARGVDAAEIDRAIASRSLWRLNPAVGLDLQAPAAEAGGQLVGLRDLGLPSPRRLRVDPGEVGLTLGAAIEREWRVDPASQAALLNGGVLRAEGLWSDAAAVVPASAHIALLERDVDVIDGFMRLVYAENPGAAWSLLRDAPVRVRTTFFLLMALLASLAMTWAIWTGWMGTTAGAIALGGVLGGALGNMLDRGRYTVVVDFILNYVGEHRWPVWNVADAGISVGVAAILLEMLFGIRHGPQPQPADGSNDAGVPSADTGA